MRVDLERRETGGEHGLGEVVRKAAGDDGDDAGRGKRARSGYRARTAAEVLTGDQHVVRRDARRERRVEVDEEVASRFGGRVRGEARGQDVLGAQPVRERPRPAGEDRQAEHAAAFDHPHTGSADDEAERPARAGSDGDEPARVAQHHRRLFGSDRAAEDSIPTARVALRIRPCDESEHDLRRLAPARHRRSCSTAPRGRSSTSARA